MLQAAQKEAIVARVAAVERATGVQVVTAVVPRAHAWPEAVWAAFALAAALAGLGVVLLEQAWRAWPAAGIVLVAVAIVLGAGAASALLAIVLPAYARQFTGSAQRDAEVRRCARLVFHEHGLSHTRGRCGVLILVACFERRVEVVADRGFDGRIAPAEWNGVVSATAGALQRDDAGAALLAGLDRLEALLLGHGFAGSGANELPDAPLEIEVT